MAEKKVIWITGASSGIGKALAIKFAENGWIVAASARRENLLKELQNINQNIYPYPLDVTDIEKCKSTAKSIIDNLSGIDICVFGTGMHDPKSEKQNGQISIISSVAGYRGLPAAGAYCASKAALTSFAESLYFDMQMKNVHVSLISPGFIKTPMTDQNDFPMPMIKSPEFAANEIFKGLTIKKGFEIHFPKAFTYFLKFLQILPSGLYFKLVSKGMKKIDY